MSTPKRASRDEVFRSLIAKIVTEVLFILLPFVIILIVLLFQGGTGKASSIFNIPEWSFTAVILTGQTIVKSIPLLIENKEHINAHLSMAALALLLVGVFIPSLIVLIFMLISAPNPPLALVITQIAFFIVSLFTFTLPERVDYEIQKIIKSKSSPTQTPANSSNSPSSP